MVMADYDKKSRSRYKKEKERDDIHQISKQIQIKIPTILTKSSANLKNGYTTEPNDEVAKNTNASYNKNGITSSQSNQQIYYKSSPIGINGLKQLVLNGKRWPINIFDEALNMMDKGSDILSDQENFLVVGVIGQQGVGKSTILSYMAALKNENEGFSVQTKDSTRHLTSGVDMIVTNERIILLDSQPVLSMSVVHQMLRNERKQNRESRDYQSTTNQLEINSIQSAAFMLSVCNVIMIVVDFFIEDIIANLIHVSELLKPIKTTETESNDESIKQNAPHIVFVLNKASQSDFSPSRMSEMREKIKTLMASSKFNYTGMRPIKMSIVLPGKYSKKMPPCMSNLFLLPKIAEGNSSDGVTNGLNYRGHFGFEDQLVQLKREILALPRTLPINKISEKKWLQYAARTADSLKKNPMLAEYARLLNN